MRRAAVLLAAVLGAATLGGVGCASGGASPAFPAPSPAAPTGPAVTAAGSEAPAGPGVPAAAATRSEGAPAPADGAAPEAGTAARQDVPTLARRTPLLPWPFYRSRSLARLGPHGIAGLRPGSPERRLLEMLRPEECAGDGEPVGSSCFFLEGGTVYEIRREAPADGGPMSFHMTRVAVGSPDERGRRYALDRRDPARPYLLTILRPGAATVDPAARSDPARRQKAP